MLVYGRKLSHGTVTFGGHFAFKFAEMGKPWIEQAHIWFYIHEN